MKDDSRLGMILVLLVAAAAGAGAWFWLKTPAAPPPPAAVAPPPAPPAAPPAADAAPPAIQHPIEAAEEKEREPLPALGESDPYIERLLGDLLGRKAVQSLLNLDGIANRFVATVDNLGGPLATPRLWPVRPTEGRLQTESGGQGTVIGTQNAARYGAFLALVDRVETRRAVRLYVRLYPLFQKAYEELGHSGRYFNDRLVEVIDSLLAAPTPSGPIALRPLRVEGETAPSSIYLFADPALESLPSGQKILVRMGPENAARLRAKLTELRAQITRQAALPGGR